MSRSKAFSLLELLTILIIVIILSGIAFSSMTRWLNKAKAKVVAEQLVSDIQWVRSLSLKYGSATIKFYSNKYEIYAPSFTLVKTVSLPNGLSLSENFGSSLDFMSNTLPEENGTITISGFGKTYRIIINLNGGVRLEEV